MQQALIFLALIIFILVKEASGISSERAVSKPGCPDKCGNVTIPYPFGIGDHCAASSRNPYFIVTCNNTFQPSWPIVGDITTSVEVIDISLEHGMMCVYNDVSYTCFTSDTIISDNHPTGFNLNSTPFIPSTTRNQFTVIGCNTLGLIGGYMHNNSDSDKYVAGCYSYCQGLNSTSENAPCAGLGCCETAISPNLTDFAAVLPSRSSAWKFNPCFYAMLVEVGWYKFSTEDLAGHLTFIKERDTRGVPVVADWAIRDGKCPKDGAKADTDYACVSSNSYCVNASNGPGYLCNCNQGYEGNPYLHEGCQDIDECKLRKLDAKYKELYPCKNGVCRNKPGGYTCTCRMGKISDGTNSGCRPVLGKTEQVVIGILDDNKEVAIKKSKVIYTDCREEFVKEIIILSQINHSNIVRLLGCCLEVDVPILVYEFISNGTLFQFLHGNESRSPAPLDLRLKIATQSAEALAYIHSSTSRAILHGDVKSPNILLDDEYNAKVSDFGASALKSMDKNDFIMLIQGTLGYLDPEYLVSHHLTDKSDVYSFGVVLLELMTRRKALYTDTSNEKKALSHTFILMFHQNKLQDMLDTEIVDDKVMVVLEKLAELVMHCLSPKGDERPTMKEVAERLQILRRLQKQLVTKTHSIRPHYFYGGPSVPVSDEMGYQSMETAN
ncbi:hypothetical protein C2845_PM05G01710 [Panicum miliaceum]|uniref:Protein kinase domain-containing protein n=1 Tax=Panicum miliaceum TaxID=4540 RepID=A0A3L6T3N7_PANMI|nr:hypothetical protein C2845_PM05G01710 [Panicum miliaceum]